MTKKKTNSRPGLPAERIKVSSYFSKIVEGYSGDEAKRATIMDAWQKKKPKSYGLLYYPFYRFSTISLSILHMISFMCAVSVVGYLMTLNLGMTAYLFSALAILILLICEFGQHSTLNLACDLYHQTNSIPQSIIFICLVFSGVSVVSSAFGTYNFAQTYDVSTIVYALIFVSFLNEILIVYCTYYIHNYQKNAYNESHLVNDLYQGNEGNLFFDFLPKIKRLQTAITPILPIQKVVEELPEQQPEIIIQQPYKRNRKTPLATADKQGAKVKKHKAKSPQNTVAQDVKENYDNIATKKQVGKLCTKYFNRYFDNPTKIRTQNKTFYKYALDHFDRLQTNGTIRLVHADAKEFATVPNNLTNMKDSFFKKDQL